MIGDPHLVTLDGFKYTFNGHGEFTIIETTNSSLFTLQGRMVPILKSNGEFADATIFSALVARQEDSDTLQFELSRRGLDVLINGDLVQFGDLNERQFHNVRVNSLGYSTYSATFTSGVYIKVKETNAIISLVNIVLPSNFRGRTEGLLGNYNGNPTDDLQPKSSNVPISVNSTIQELHMTFGITCKLYVCLLNFNLNYFLLLRTGIIDDEHDSLFSYGVGEEWSEFYSPQFTPTYHIDTSSSLADEVCGDDQFCRFDITATGRRDVAVSTLEESFNVQLVVNLSLPGIVFLYALAVKCYQLHILHNATVVCNPQCENGVCIANGTCSCSAGFTGQVCTEKGSSLHVLYIHVFMKTLLNVLHSV